MNSASLFYAGKDDINARKRYDTKYERALPKALFCLTNKLNFGRMEVNILSKAVKINLVVGTIFSILVVIIILEENDMNL